MVIADTFTNLSCYMSHDVKQGAHNTRASK